MTSKIAWLPFLLAAAFGLTGCASAPVRYYTLMAPVADTSSATAPYQIELLPVGIPEALDRQALVVRQGEAGIVVLDRERWVAPLDEEVRRALSLQLAARLGAQDVTGLARAPDQPILRIKVEIRRLDAWLGQQVNLDADWSLGFAESPQRRSVCHSNISKPTPANDSEALVKAYQQVLSTLAQQIAEAAKASNGTGRGVCV